MFVGKKPWVALHDWTTAILLNHTSEPRVLCIAVSPLCLLFFTCITLHNFAYFGIILHCRMGGTDLHNFPLPGVSAKQCSPPGNVKCDCIG